MVSVLQAVGYAIGSIAFLVVYYSLIKPLMARQFFKSQGIKMTDFVFWKGDQGIMQKYAKEGRMQFMDGDQRDQLGAKYFLSLFGTTPRLICLDTNLLREVFGKAKEKYFDKSPHTAALLEPLLGAQGLFLTPTDYHKKYRPLINPAFHFTKLNVMAEVMIKTCQRQYPVWREQQLKEINANTCDEKDFTKVEMHKAFNGLGLEIVVSTVMGADFKDTETQSVMYNSFNSLVGTILKRFINRTSLMPIIKDLPIYEKPDVDAGVERVRTVIGKIIKDRRDGKTKAICDGEDLLDILLAIRDDKGKAMSEEQILDHTMTFVFAGHEPTANLLTWAMWSLTHNPETLKKCMDEVDQVLGKEVPTVENIKQLKYLEAFLKEVLRMFPPAAYIRRKANQDIRCGKDKKFTVPKGTEIMTNFYAIHHDPDYWREPETFRPERFLEQPSEPGVRKAFYPFGLGPRVCIGQSFAMLESKIMLAMFLQNFQIKLVPDQKFEVDMKITMHPRHGVWVYSQPRDLPKEYFEWTEPTPVPSSE